VVVPDDNSLDPGGKNTRLRASVKVEASSHQTLKFLIIPLAPTTLSTATTQPKTEKPAQQKEKRRKGGREMQRGQSI
jgi:hypothetical protein